MRTLRDAALAGVAAESRIVVVGGGPAGCAAAHAAACARFRVTLLERSAPGRDKTCGDLFMPSAVTALQRLGLDRAALAAVGGISCGAIDVMGTRGRLWRIQYPDSPAWMLPRRRLDQRLRDALPATVTKYYNANVTEIALDAARNFHIKTALGIPADLVCQAVVLACGSQSRLARRWGLVGTPLVVPSISAYIPRGSLDSPAFEVSASCRPGYRWLFPASDGMANAGVFPLSPVRGAVLKALGHSLLEDWNAADVHWRGGVGTLWSGRGEYWHDPRGVIACGDAAGLIDPLTGEGLSAALISGEEAGTAIADFLLRGRDPERLRRYSSWVHKFFTSAYSASPSRTAWKQLCGAT